VKGADRHPEGTTVPMTSMPLVGAHVYEVVCGQPTDDVYAPTCTQAWDLVRVRLEAEVFDARWAGDEARVRALEGALADLDEEGAQPYGWWAEIDGDEYWYGPRWINRPAEVSLGEAALLLAVTTTVRGGAGA